MRCTVDLRCDRCGQVRRTDDPFFCRADIGSPGINLKFPCPSCGGIGVTVVSLNVDFDNGIVEDEEWPEYIGEE